MTPKLRSALDAAGSVFLTAVAIWLIFQCLVLAVAFVNWSQPPVPDLKSMRTALVLSAGLQLWWRFRKEKP